MQQWKGSVYLFAASAGSFLCKDITIKLQSAKHQTWNESVVIPLPHVNCHSKPGIWHIFKSDKVSHYKGGSLLCLCWKPTKPPPHKIVKNQWILIYFQNVYMYIYKLFSIHRLLGREHSCSGQFTFEEVEAAYWEPCVWGLTGECVGHPKRDQQSQRKTWSNPWTIRQRKQSRLVQHFFLLRNCFSSSIIYKIVYLVVY